jgi:N-acyl-D-amino-acid deacylase
MSDDFDILIKNATIVDGTGDAPYKGAVAVKGERIAAVGRLEGDLEKGAETIIDAKGRVTSPGFIDVHNHGDISILHYPAAEGFLRQGITTFVGGNCGSSPGPYNDFVDLGMFLYDIHYEVNPDMYYPDGLVQRELLNERHREAYGWEIDWHTLGEFFKRVEARGISPNYVPVVGHHPIRNIVMGRDFRRTATEAEVEAMKDHLRQAMEDGCSGFSVGRDYESSYYADLDELVALAKVAAEYGGVYTSHSLRTGLRKARRPGEFPPVKVEGLKEAIEVGRQAGIPVQISHLGTLYDVTPGGDLDLAEAAARATLKIVDDAREEGVDVHFDMIPNNRGFGIYSSNWLAASLLPWLKVAGSREQLAEALRMGEFREEIKEKIWAGKWYRLNPNITPNWAGTQRIMECKDGSFVDKTVAEIAEELGKNELDVLMDVLMVDPYAKVGTRGFDNPTKGMFYKHPASMVGIDTFAIDTDWETKHPPWYRPSENSFGGFAAYFMNAVRESKFLSVEEAVRKVTSLPAEKFKLSDRGVLKPGAYADIVVMDLEKVTPKAGPLTPNVYPEGIEHVVVNGIHVVRDSEHTGARPGKVLYRE